MNQDLLFFAELNAETVNPSPGTVVKLSSSSGEIPRKSSSIIQSEAERFVRKNSKTRMAFLSAVLSLSAAPLLCQNAIASEDAAGASAAVIVNASPKAVWRAVHEERFHDPDISFVRVLQQTSNRMTLEEVFQSVPILGSVTAVLEQREVPYGRIDYSLIRSDKFKSMSGSWCLTPVGDGHQTLLKLTSFIDLGIPFSSVFLHGAAQQKLNRRLAHVKEMAEQMHIAASAEEAL